VDDVGVLVRTGVFGGTFDPPHIGHVATALEVWHKLRLDRVLMVVANDPWQKSGQREVTDAKIRLHLVELAVEGFSPLIASDMEIRRGGESYTADTLTQLHRDGGDEIFLMVGSDAAAGLDTWKRPNEVRSMATTVVVDRGGSQGGRPPAGWPHVVVDVPALEISSSDIRARFVDGRPVEALIARQVATHARHLGLYGSGK